MLNQDIEADMLLVLLGDEAKNGRPQPHQRPISFIWITQTKLSAEANLRFVVKLWFRDVVKLWFRDVVKLWFRDVVKLWFRDVVKLWFRDVVKLWFRDVVKL
ncbi:hypothetical protein M8J76_011715 [Diaphorina citri]|nr:hypothetical protein M8J76_011715 [Diaphorina citri]